MLSDRENRSTKLIGEPIKSTGTPRCTEGGGAAVQVAAVFEWVSDSLRHPGATYELFLPSRKPLVTSLGTVRAADLLPSALLNFRWLESPPPAGPSLQDSLMAAAVPAAS